MIASRDTEILKFMKIKTRELLSLFSLKNCQRDVGFRIL